MGLQGGALLLWRMHAGPPQEEAQPMDQDHDAGNGLSSHIDETIASLVALRQTHRKAAAPLQRLVSHLTDGLSRPRTVLVLTGLVVAWIALNLTLPLTGHVAIDPPPFFWLDGALSLVSVYMLFLVLASQRNESQLERRRELLSLELAVRGEEKTAKVIALIEELRRDLPQVRDRIDEEAVSMAKPADTASVIAVIAEKPTEAELVETDPEPQPRANG